MSLNVQHQEPLAPLTTFKVGGSALQYVHIESEEELVEAVAYAQEQKLKLSVLAGGSNVLVPDAGVDGLVLHIAIKGIKAVEEGEKVLLYTGAGEELDALVAHTVAHNWWGLENLSHIPGSVGATPVQNVGAYGTEAGDVIQSVRAYNTETKGFEVLDASACAFEYRDSLFKKTEGQRYIITNVVFALSREPKPQLSYRDLDALFAGANPSQLEIREAVMKIRAGKFPDWNKVGTAGSFFKNPIIAALQYQELKKQYPELPGFELQDGTVKIPLGWILDKVLNLRGFKKGNVEAYKKQALVLVAHEDATASEIEAFANDIISKVKEQTGIEVQWEVTKMM